MTRATIDQPKGTPAISNDWIRVGTLAELQAEGSRVIRGADRPIVVFASNGVVSAVDNRCPHLGFPLNKGTVQDGILTCHWHQARFDLCSGCTFDLWADDVPAFETRVTGGDVFVRSLPHLDKDRFKRQLIKGMAQNISLLQAKGLVGMLADKTPVLDLIREILSYGVQYQTTGQGLTELAIAGNLAHDLQPQTLYHVLLRGSQQIAQAASNSRRPPREALAGEHYSLETLDRWFNQWILLRDADAAERVLLTAIKMKTAPAQLADMMFGAVSQRIYQSQGHTVDLLNKSMELLDNVGWNFAAKVLPLAVAAMASGRGSEEDVRWHRPINLIELIRDAEKKLPDALEQGKLKKWTAPPELCDVLLGEDPAAIIRALIDALSAGAPAAELSQRIAYAAAMRLAHFANANEIGDWFNPQHTFSYANAVDQAIRRSPTPVVIRSMFHAAMSVYMDRFLNVPPAKLPQADDLQNLPRDADALGKQLLEELDGRSNLQAGGRIVSRYLSQGHPVSSLIDLLAEATVREDLDFHTLQVLEGGFRQASQWGDGRQATNIFIAIIRDLAAFCPTPRARLKTAVTAMRLHHGEQVYSEE